MRKVVLLVCLGLSVLVAFSQDEEAYSLLVESYLESEDYVGMTDFFEQELKKYPKNEIVLRKLGYGYGIQENYALAKKYYLEAIEVNPACLKCYDLVARVVANQGDYELSNDYIAQGLEVDDGYANLYSLRAMLKEMDGDIISSKMDHNKAVELDPLNTEILLNRARFNDNRKYLSFAFDDYSKVIELGMDDYYPYYRRAGIYHQYEMLDEAYADISKAIELDPTVPELFMGRGSINDDKSNFEQAASDYSKAIELSPEDFNPYSYRAFTYYQLEDMDASCSDYETVLLLMEKYDVDDPELIHSVKQSLEGYCDSTIASYYYQRGIANYNLDRFEEGVKIYNRGLESFPNHSMMLSFRGNAYLRLYEFEKALDNYKKSYQYKEQLYEEFKENQFLRTLNEAQIKEYFEGSVATLHFGMAKCYQQLGNPKKAMNEINTAIDVVPIIGAYDQESIYNFRGNLYLAKGEYKNALSDYNYCITKNPGVPFAYVNRAIVRINQVNEVKLKSFYISSGSHMFPLNLQWNSRGAKDEKLEREKILSALNDLNVAIKIDPNFMEAYYLRAQIKQILGHSDFCSDFKKAKSLGYEVEMEFLIECE